VTEGIAAPPQYFPVNAKINKEGYESLEMLLQKSLEPLTVSAFKQLIKKDDIIMLDTRNGALFMQGFVPGSISIGLEGRFAEWAGTLLPFDKTIVLVTEEGQEKESAIRLARVGFQLFGGYLQGGFEAWKKSGEEIDIIIDVDADEVAMDLPFDEKMVIVDVRKEAEFDDGHIKDAVNIPLTALTDPGSMAPINDDDNLYVHCAGGYRSIIACSLLKRQGIHNLRNINGGFAALKGQESIKFEKNAEALN
ncbi:MAG TPA: rhodanese-like domain-containing protein, partial [Chitinophagaceae bacterium]|nr:rhodanese-like domain-containing protein [Chitinophagaceae bacterium]